MVSTFAFRRCFELETLTNEIVKKIIILKSMVIWSEK
jgi:hypothetical protein